MGKGKSKARDRKPSSTTKQVIKRRQHSQNQPLKQQAAQARAQKQSQQRRPRLPFSSSDNVLLVGEGNFSFALSLLKNHQPASLTATCYDTEVELFRKYPNAESTIQELFRQSAEVEGQNSDEGNTHEEWSGHSSRSASEDDIDKDDKPQIGSSKCIVLYEIDGTKLSTSHRKKLRSFKPFSRIVFNFPHVGGLSTDVNRQVRSNQQLLVGFFNAAKPLLSRPRGHKDNTVPESVAGSSGQDGQILVTIFEGEPYSLWNIRDLARHCGLKVVESFRFLWDAYPGYQHARTIGEITTGIDRTAEGRRKGAWRGEEREARCYVFECQGDAASPSKPKKQKRSGNDMEDDSD